MAQKELQAGDVVVIYQDPITEERREGEARLIKRHAEFRPIDYERERGLQLEWWNVHFLDDDPDATVARLIKAKQ